MRRLALATAVIAAACGSKKDKPPKEKLPTGAPDAAPAAVALDAAPEPGPDPKAGALTGTDDDEVDHDEADAAAEEARLRQGKPTGLGGPTEKPEVATEDLVKALLAKKIPWTRFVDPALGLIDARLDGRSVARLCGRKIDIALTAHAKALAKDIADGAKLTCVNVGLQGDGLPFGEWQDDPPNKSYDGHTLRYALCGTDPEMEWDKGFGLMFLPDPARGLRLASIEVDEGGGEPGAAMGEYGDELVKTGTLCK